MSELAEQLQQVKQGDHLCLVYDSHDEQMAAVVPFLQAGFAAGERCLYIADDRTLAEVRHALAHAGVDVEAELERGALLLVTKQDAYLLSGAFSPDEMIAFLRQHAEEALAAGFTGLCLTGEMTWALGPEIGCERLIEYEARLNELIPHARMRAVCQYSRKRFPAATIRDVLRTHPVAVLGDQVCPNLYYEPPKMVLGESSEQERVDWMIGQLRRARASEQALQRGAEDLRHQQRWLQALFDLAPLPMIFLEPGSARLTFANKAAHEMAGGVFPDPQSVADFERLFEVTDETGRRLGGDEIPAVRAARGERFSGVEVRWRVGGNSRALILSSEQMPAMHGHPATVVLAFEDISALKETEAELRAALHARDAFLTVASHELKTPLTALQLRVRPLQKTLHQPCDDALSRERISHHLKGIDTQVRRLTQLVDELLDVSRLGSGHTQLRFEEVELGAVVREALAAFEDESVNGGSTVSAHFPSPIVGSWDRRALDHIVTNVVSNAVKYGRGRPVELALSHEDGCARLVVRDQGIGIAPEFHARIFERFARAVSERNYSGFGLGLWIAREMVEAMGGEISVSSTPGEGSTFTITLPLAQEAESVAAA